MVNRWRSAGTIGLLAMIVLGVFGLIGLGAAFLLPAGAARPGEAAGGTDI